MPYENFLCGQPVACGIQTPLNFSCRGKGRMALRGAEGDHRAKRGSSRSKRRAALERRRKRESPAGAPGGVQRGPRRGAAPNRPPLPPAAKAAQSTSKKKPPRPQGGSIPSRRPPPSTSLPAVQAVQPTLKKARADTQTALVTAPITACILRTRTNFK